MTKQQLNITFLRGALVARIILLFALLMSLAVIFPGATTEAASTTVSTEAELITAINNANANPGPDTITLGANIILSAELPTIDTEITLDGAGYYVDGADSFRVFKVTSTGDFTINNVTIQHGAVFSGRFSGGIYNHGGILTVTNSSIVHNTASYGGGLFNDDGTLILTDSLIANNSVSSYGGGLYNDGALTIVSTTFADNSADVGGAIFGDGTLDIFNGTFSGNSAEYSDGGAIYSSGILTISASTFVGNQASSGGAIYNVRGGTATVTHSTISDNHVDSYESFGGGIANAGTLTLTHNTFAGNTASGDYKYGSGLYNNGTAYLVGNVIQHGPGGSCSGTVIDQGYNLSSDESCAFSVTGSQNNVPNLNVGALSSGGPGQQVHTPVSSAAAGVIPSGTIIDNNGVTLACNDTTIDQLGSNRPLSSGNDCTAGAVEVAPLPTPVCANSVMTETELISCIRFANANPGPDTINLGATINLNVALPAIRSEIVLNGAGYAVDGGDNVRVFYVDSTGDFAVNEVMIQHGNADFEYGGGNADGDQQHPRA